MNKIEVAVVIGYIEIEQCGIDTFIDTLNKYRSEYKGYISLSPDGGYGGFDGYNVIWTREETDEEYLKEVWGYKKGVKHDDAPDNLACLLLKGKFGSLAVRVS